MNHTKGELLPCPFCGGEVKEDNPSWNMANAFCTKCNAEWGYCGRQYNHKYEKWNKRAIQKEMYEALEELLNKYRTSKLSSVEKKAEQALKKAKGE